MRHTYEEKASRRIASSVDFFFSSRRRHTRLQGDWSSDVCSSDLVTTARSGSSRVKRGIVRAGIRKNEADCANGLRSEEHTSELQSPCNLVCRLLLEKKKKIARPSTHNVSQSDSRSCNLLIPTHAD